jgi:2-dehydropantoate 2-reductase
MKRILIAGAGGVGGYIGAQLIRHTDAQITLLARGAHLEAIQTSGLIVHDNDTDYTVHPNAATDDTTSLGTFDLVLVAVKATALEATLHQIAPNIAPHTVILPLLNGVGHDRTLRTHFPDATVLDGHIYILSNLTAPGTLRRRGEVLRIVWGSEEAINPRVIEHLTTFFDAAHIRHKYTKDIRLASWRKYLFIASFAALTSYHIKPMDEVLTDHPDELQALLQEIVSVARAEAIPLSPDDITTALTQASRVAPGAKTSLQLDLEQNKPAETEALCGTIVHLGHKHGIETPVMERIYKHLK